MENIKSCFDQDSPEEKISIRDKILNESKEIIIKPENLDSKGRVLVFPEGPVSNLDEQNWKIVRTESFKKWFGDWQENKNCSVVVDENGEPKIVTHRSYEDEIILQPARVEFSVTSRFIHFTSKWIGGKSGGRYGSNVHMAFLNIRKLFKYNLFYDYPKSKKAGFVNNIDDDFLYWLLKNGYDGVYSPPKKNIIDDPEKYIMYTDEYVVLDPLKQVLFINKMNK